MTSPPRRWIGLLVVVLIVEAIYVYVVSAGKIWDWPGYMGYYDLLAEGFRAGHLYLQVQPAPELLASANPYDPALASYWMGDVSIYGGHYFFYWGPLPALLLAAVKVLFRISQPVGDQHLVFCFLSLMAVSGALLLEKMSRRLSAPAPFYLLAAGVLSFALGGPALHLLASSSVYQAALTGAQAFLMLGVMFAADVVFEAEARPPRTWRMAAAGTAWVMAMACRMSVTPAVGLLVLATAAAVARRHTPAAGGQRQVFGVPAARWRQAIRVLVWTGIPLTAGFLALLIYNKARFDRWFDFGLGRQLTTWKFTFTLRYYAANLYSYLFRRFSWSCVFPFALVPYLPRLSGPLPPWIPFQKGYVVPEPIVGLLVAAPITWLIPAALRGAVRALRGFAQAPGYLWYAGTFLVIGTVPLMTPLGLYLATMRYQIDVAPGLLMLSNLGVWTLYGQARATPRARRAVGILCASLATATVVIGLLLGYQGYTGHFQRFNPELSSALERHLSFCPGASH